MNIINLIKSFIITFCVLCSAKKENTNDSSIKNKTLQVLSIEQFRKKYHITGNIRIDERRIYDLVNSALLASKDIKLTLLQSGWFSDVNITTKNKSKIVITVTEYPVVGRLYIEGEYVIGEDELRVITGLYERSFVSWQFLYESVARLEQYYRMIYAHANVSVSVKYFLTNQKRLDLAFKVNVNRKSSRYSIRFFGNKEILDYQLEQNFVQKPFSVLFVLNFATLNVDALEQSKFSMEQYANNLGYLDFTVKSIAVDQSANGNIVNVVVNEGVRYKINKIEKFIDHPKVDRDKIIELITIKTGDFYSKEVLDDIKYNVNNWLKDKKLYFVRMNFTTEKLADGKMNIRFQIHEDDIIKRIRNIHIKGNSRTYDNVILGRLGIAPGDACTEKVLNDARIRLIHTGLFNNVEVTENTITNYTSDIDVKVEECGAGVIGFKVESGGSLDSTCLTFNYQDPNLFGNGISSDIRASIYYNSTLFTLNAQSQYIYGLPIIVFGNLSYSSSVLGGILFSDYSNSFFRDLMYRDYVDFKKAVNDMGNSHALIKEEPNENDTKKDILQNIQYSEHDSRTSIKCFENRTGGSIGMRFFHGEHTISLKAGAYKRSFQIINQPVIKSEEKLNEDMKKQLEKIEANNNDDNNSMNLTFSTMNKSENNDSEGHVRGNAIIMTKGVGISRFFTDQYLPKYKYELSPSISYRYNKPLKYGGANFGGEADWTFGTTNVLKLKADMSLSLSLNRNWGTKFSARCGRLFAGKENRSWLDNFVSGEVGVCGFESFGPIDLWRFNYLGGQKFYACNFEFTRSVNLISYVPMQLYIKAGMGSLWDCGINPEKMNLYVSVNRGWSKDKKLPLDIASNDMQIVSSAGLGLKCKVANYVGYIGFSKPIYGMTPVTLAYKFEFGVGTSI